MGYNEQDQLKADVARLQREKDRLDTQLKKSEHFLDEAEGSTRHAQNVVESLGELFYRSDDRRFFESHQESLHHDGNAYLSGIYDRTDAIRQTRNKVEHELEHAMQLKKKLDKKEEAENEH